MRAWPAPAQGLLATGFSGTITPPLNLSPLSAFGTAIQLNSQQSITYDAANSTGIMNGVNAQTLSVYNTFTAGTPDYERLSLFWSGNIGILDTQKSGTGASRALSLRMAGSEVVNISTSGLLGLGLASSAGAVNFVTLRTAFNATSGTVASLAATGTCSDGGTNSSTVVNLLSLSPTINYTAATKTGAVRLAYFAPVNTSLPTGLNGAAVFSSTASGLTGATIYHNVSDETTNFEYVAAKWASNVFTYSMVAAGSGTWRNIAFTINDPAAQSVVALTSTSTITGGVTDGYAAAFRLTPTYNAGTALTVTRHNYIDVNQITLGGAGPAAVTDACVFRFNAAAGTHKAVDSGTTKTSPGTVTQWIKVNVNGVVNYIPSYSSKTT